MLYLLLLLRRKLDIISDRAPVSAHPNPRTHPPTHLRTQEPTNPRKSAPRFTAGYEQRHMNQKMAAQTSPRPPPFLKPRPLSNCRLLFKKGRLASAKCPIFLCPYQPGKGRLTFEDHPESTAFVLSERALRGLSPFFSCTRTPK